MVKRRAALLLGLLFGFRLVAVGGALVCTAHGSHQHAAEPSQHHHEDSAPSHDSKETPCTTPEAADCCTAMASCSSVLSSATLVVTTALPDHGDAVRRFASALHFRPHTPDPPPPRS